MDYQAYILNSNNAELHFWFAARLRLTKSFLYLKLLRKINFKSDARPVNPVVNKILFAILDFENTLMNHGIKFHFGLTICGIAKKNVG